MKLYGSEPEITHWSALSLSEIVRRIPSANPDRAIVIAIDGHSGGGKSTFARKLSAQLDAALLATDDFAWWHSMFDWHDILLPNGLLPLKKLASIDYRPPAWIERERVGTISVAAKPFVIVEGVGAAQRAIRSELDFVVWVQSDIEIAEQRGIERDLVERPDPVEAKRFWDEWQAAEVPFQESQRTWEIADLIVCGTCDSVNENTAQVATPLVS